MRYTEQNLPQYLAKSEAELSTNDFLRRMKLQQELDPANFQLAEVSLAADAAPYLLIMGEHSFKRCRQRLGFMSKQEVQQYAIELLQIHEVKEAVQAYFVTWDEGKILAGDDSGIDSVVVKDTKSQLTYCFVSGFSYILVKTVWDNLNGDFHTNARNYVITV